MTLCRSVADAPSSTCAGSKSSTCPAATKRPLRVWPSCTCAGSTRFIWAAVDRSWTRPFTPARDPKARRGLLQTDHGRGLRASARDPNAHHGRLQPGDRRGRDLCAHARNSEAQNARLQSVNHPDAAFAHLCGILLLDMSRCNHLTIMDTAFVNLCEKQLYMSELGDHHRRGFSASALDLHTEHARL